MFISPLISNNTYLTKTSFYGWQPENKKNRDKIEQMVRVIKDPEIKNIAVSGHMMPDGDSISSCIACASLLHQTTGKNVDVYIFGNMPDKYKFLTQNADGLNIIEINPDTKLDKRYDLCVSVDTSAVNLMDKNYYQNVFKTAKHSLKIDHHPENISNQNLQTAERNYADINMTDTKCAAASEVLMQFVKPLGLSPKDTTKTFNDAVYSGIISDTAGYKFVDNAIVFNDASLLLKRGTNHSKITKSLFTKKELPQSIFDLDNALKTNRKFTSDGKIGYIVIDNNTEEFIKKAEEDTDKITVATRLKKAVGQILDVNNTEIAFYTRIIKNDDGEDEVACSIRSNEIPINEAAAKFGGGGHEKAAGIHYPSQNKTSQEWADDLLSELTKLV